MRFLALSLLVCGALATGLPWYAAHTGGPKLELRYDQSLDVTVSPPASPPLQQRTGCAGQACPRAD